MLGAEQAGYNANLGAYNAQQAAGGNMMGGLFGIGGAILGAPAGSLGAGIGAAMMSDRRLKRHIKRIGTADNGLNVYSYQYAWGGPTQIGYMADEVERVSPDAVITTSSGYKAVDYGRV